MSDSTEKSAPAITPYQAMGEADAVRRLVHRFYELMDSLPEAEAVRKLHPTDLTGSEEKLFMYLSGWLGGPSLYIEKFGHPRLRARHLPFSIGVAERDQWLMCMERAMLEQIEDARLRGSLLGAMSDLADFMRNRAEEAASS